MHPATLAYEEKSGLKLDEDDECSYLPPVEQILQHKPLNLRTVVLKLVGSIEPNRCHASIHRTLNYNQERIQKILEGDAVLN